MTNDKHTSRVSRRDVGRLAAGAVLGQAMLPTIGRAQPATLRVMSIQATTGPSSPYGWRARDGAQIVADDINAAGPSRRRNTYPLLIPPANMANDSPQAITLLR